MTPELAAAIDSIAVKINPAGMQTLNIVLAFVMFGVALGIRPGTFAQILRKPKSALVGLLSQIVLLPALTFLLTLLLGSAISPMMALGMILVASCPGGNISNFISSLSKANVELSVSLTAVNTALATFTTPANFAFWGRLYLRHAEINGTLPGLEIPFREIFDTIIILLGIPLVLGILCARYLPRLTEAIRKPLQYLSIAFFIAIVAIALGQNFAAFEQCIRYIFLTVFLHNLLALLTGYCCGSIFRTGTADRRTLAIETGIQNSGLGLVLLFNPAIFGDFPPHGGMLVITAWWGIWHIISGLGAAFIFSRFPKL